MLSSDLYHMNPLINLHNNSVWLVLNHEALVVSGEDAGREIQRSWVQS